MYGTVAKLKVKKGMIDKLSALLEVQEREIPGAQEIYIYQMDENPDEFYMTVVFDNKELYFKNANSSEQDQQFKEMMKYLEEEPEWHDGEIIYYRDYEPK
jgi:quinol monooxygenase YgiN